MVFVRAEEEECVHVFLDSAAGLLWSLRLGSESRRLVTDDSTLVSTLLKTLSLSLKELSAWIFCLAAAGRAGAAVSLLCCWKFASLTRILSDISADDFRLPGCT